MLRDSSTGEIIGLAPFFDYNLGLISTGVPRIDSVKGNVFTDSFLANEVCCKALKSRLPDMDAIMNSIAAAEHEIAKSFPNVSLNYPIISDYIIRTYDFITASL